MAEAARGAGSPLEVEGLAQAPQHLQDGALLGRVFSVGSDLVVSRKKQARDNSIVMASVDRALAPPRNRTRSHLSDTRKIVLRDVILDQQGIYVLC